MSNVATSIQLPTRSRTLLFLSYRDSSSRSSRRSRYRQQSIYPDSDLTQDDERQGLIREDYTSIDITPPPKWVDVSDQVGDILDATVTKLQTLDKLHAKHVLPGFTDKSAEEREIELLTTEITRSFRRCQALIEQIVPNKQHKFPPSTSTSQDEISTAKNLQRGLAARLQDVSAAFRKKQRVYLEKLQGHSIKNQDLLIAAGTMSLDSAEGVMALEDDIHVASQSQAQVNADPDLRARDRELREIANSITSLAELFRDLSSLVIDQGTILDSVEYNIETTAVQMDDAVKELQAATRHQKNTGRRMCIFLLLLIIFGLIMVLIFKPRRRSQPDVAPAPTLSSLR